MAEQKKLVDIRTSTTAPKKDNVMKTNAPGGVMKTPGVATKTPGKDISKTGKR